MDRKPLSPGDYVLAVLFGAAVIVVAAQVLWRYAFNDSLVWTEEASRYLFVWMTFIGAALAIKEGTHIRVNLIIDKLPRRIARHLGAIQLTLIAVFLCFLSVVGFQWVRLTANTRTPALGLPLNYVLYGSLPIAAALGAWFAVRRALAGEPEQDEEDR